MKTLRFGPVDFDGGAAEPLHDENKAQRGQEHENTGGKRAGADMLHASGIRQGSDAISADAAQPKQNETADDICGTLHGCSSWWFK